MISIRLDGVKELMDRLDPVKVQSAARAALERTKASSKSESVRLITSVWNIKKRDLETKASGGERIKVSGSVGSDLTATLTFYAGGISLVYFGAKEFRLTVARSKQTAKRMGQTYTKGSKTLLGIRVQPLRGGKVDMLRQFIGKVKYGKDKSGVHIGVFRRLGKARLPIIESQTVGVTTMIRQPKVMQPLQQFITDTFNKRLVHELQRRGLTS